MSNNLCENISEKNSNSSNESSEKNSNSYNESSEKNNNVNHITDNKIVSVQNTSTSIKQWIYEQDYIVCHRDYIDDHGCKKKIIQKRNIDSNPRHSTLTNYGGYALWTDQTTLKKYNPNSFINLLQIVPNLIDYIVIIVMILIV